MKETDYQLPLKPDDVKPFLKSCGVSDLFIDRILGKYRTRAAEVISADPYSMVENVWRLSFDHADKIGQRLGIAADDPRRLQAALVTAVKRYAEAGHLFARPEQAVAKAAQVAGLPEEAVAREIPSAVALGRLVESEGCLYLPVFYKAETEVADKLGDLADTTLPAVDSDLIPKGSRTAAEYSPEQTEAIQRILENPVAVLTGGPGAGKTTVLSGIVEALTARGKKVILAAPTGRAAKRMSTLTGHDATTIHRLLGYRQGEGYRKRTIDADAVIIDEGSMMEQVLFNHLLDGVRPGTQIILVGDVDQLPAIGAGDVLRDIIDSGRVPVVNLDGNYRQEAASGIAAAARAIRSGTMPLSRRGSDFMIVEEESAESIKERLIKLVAVELPDEYGIAPTDIRVVTPQQVGPLGARRLNADLQERLNPDGAELRRGEAVYRVGDPVLQRSNSRSRGLYNGEVGIVTSVDPDAESLVATFDGDRRSVYTRSELSELTLAYATTVHKLQGSETQCMVMPVTMAHKPMLYRNLIYTGVSRATRLCVLVGEREAIRYALDNNPARTRNSNFRHRLSRTFK